MRDDLIVVTGSNCRDSLVRSDSRFESIGLPFSYVRTLRTEPAVLTGIWQ